MNQKTLSLSAWISLLSLATIWGGSFLAYSLILREVPVFTMVANRVVWASFTLWLVVLLLKFPMPNFRQCCVLFVMGFLNNAIPFSLIAWGQTHIESGLASILNGTTAIITFALASIVFRDERLSFDKSIGLLFALLGVCIIIGFDTLTNFDLRSLAQLFLICACFSYAVAAIWARSKLKGVNPIMAATGMLSSASIIMVPLAFMIDGVPNYDLGKTTIISMIFLSVPATAIAYLLYYRALNLAGSANLSLVTLLVPPMAILWGSLFLGEKLMPSAYLGFLLITLGMCFIDGRLFNRKKR
ncbi:DMT family transporter [Amylibacter sp.]|nr:DMT family transporter [Amylibacter sp.]